MKKQSVLIRRALLFTAIVLTAAIAVGLPTGLLLSRNAAVRAARQELLPEARLMAAAAQSGDGALHTSAELFGAAGGVAWLAADEQTKVLTEYIGAVPEVLSEWIDRAMEGYECLGDARVGGRNYAFAAVPAGSTESPAALIAMLPATESGSALCVLAAALAGHWSRRCFCPWFGPSASCATWRWPWPTAIWRPGPTSARRARSASWPRR